MARLKSLRTGRRAGAIAVLPSGWREKGRLPRVGTPAPSRPGRYCSNPFHGAGGHYVGQLETCPVCLYPSQPPRGWPKRGDAECA